MVLYSHWRTFGLLTIAIGLATAAGKARERPRQVFPDAAWERRPPAAVGLDPARLAALVDLVGGRGCLVRRGYLVFEWGDTARAGDVASACKPVISTLLLLAIQEGRIGSVDDPVANFEPRLRELNGGKDATITWRHLAHQTSGYGLIEPPGIAYAYNDYALALYYDVLTEKVYREPGTALLRRTLAEPLRFQDPVTFTAFGPHDRPGRLAISPRDFARFGLLYLRGGRWGERQILREDLVRLAIGSPLPAHTPLASGREAEMLPGQRTLGGGKQITAIRPGYYSFNWWVNRRDRQGRTLFVAAPPDTIVASGHGGRRALWLFPGWDLIVSWNDAQADDQDRCPGNPDTTLNRAVRLIREAILDD